MSIQFVSSFIFLQLKTGQPSLEPLRVRLEGERTVLTALGAFEYKYFLRQGTGELHYKEKKHSVIQ